MAKLPCFTERRATFCGWCMTEVLLLVVIVQCKPGGMQQNHQAETPSLCDLLVSFLLGCFSICNHQTFVKVNKVCRDPSLYWSCTKRDQRIGGFHWTAVRSRCCALESREDCMQAKPHVLVSTLSHSKTYITSTLCGLVRLISFLKCHCWCKRSLWFSLQVHVWSSPMALVNFFILLIERSAIGSSKSVNVDLMLKISSEFWARASENIP